MAFDTDISEVLDKLDIGAYLDREAIDYRESHGSSGAQYNLRECPVCGGAKWKVFLNVESGLGNCFSGDCEAKFNKWSFIKAHTNLAPREVIEHIKAVASELGWRPPRKSLAVDIERAPLKLPYSLPIPINGRNLKYLENRGITIPVAEYFALRYCHKGLWAYTDPKFGDRKFVNFGQRVIIPVFDLDGTLVSFQARDVTGKAEKKYLFPNGYASTGEYLYNGHNVRATERVLVGEGAFDVAAQKIALDGDSELRDVVPIGTFGKHVAVGQLAQFERLRERGVREVTMMWDGEQKATDDAIKAGMQLLGMGFTVRVAMLPAGRDPNEVAPEVVRAAFYRAMPLTTSNAIKIVMARRIGI